MAVEAVIWTMKSRSDISSPMAYETIDLDLRGAVAWITLNRPDALNSISPQMIDDLNYAFDQLETIVELRALVITGAGRAFCAGADLKASRARLNAETPARTNELFLNALGDILRRVENFPCPVVAAVNGLALAGGLELVLCCDLVVAAEDAKIGDAHANYGLVPGGGSSARLPRKIGPMRAKYLLYTADFLPAQTLKDWGLVFDVVPTAKLSVAVDELTQKLSSKSPIGLRRMKQMVDDGLEQPLDTALRHELTINAMHAESYDRKEGLAAFAEKRKPIFKGQ